MCYTEMKSALTVVEKAAKLKQVEIMEKTKEVTISVRQVYHKYAEVTIDIPKGIEDIQEYLMNHEGLWEKMLDNALDVVDYQGGNGIEDYDGMEDVSESSEYRFDTIEADGKSFGGHL